MAEVIKAMKYWNGYEVCDDAARKDILKLNQGKAEAEHTHKLIDIEGVGTDVLPTKMGGTGRSNHTANSILSGNGSGSINNISTMNGAFYATGKDRAAQFGILPVAQGGTGQTTIEGIKNAIGFGENGVLPITSGGTGATTAEQALSNLGAAQTDHDHQITHIESESNDCSVEMKDGSTIDVKATTIMINGREYNKNQILVDCQVYMNGEQDTREFANGARASEQPHGLVFVFSYYEKGAAEPVKDTGWSTHFVPKDIISKDGAHTFLMVYNDNLHVYFGMKQLYINDREIGGHMWNDQYNTNNETGITFHNDRFVLRYVIGV